MLSSPSKVHVPGNPGTDLWAPEVTRVGDEYYVYYSVSSFGTQISTIGLATSKDMSCGSWTDLGSTSVESQTGDAYNAIDASLLNDDGVWRMTFGSFWSNIYQVEMESPPTEKVSGAEPKQLAFEPEGEHPEEGPALVKYGDLYYLFFSWGKCCGYDANRPAAGEEYRIKVCRSESVSGGFVSSLMMTWAMNDMFELTLWCRSTNPAKTALLAAAQSFSSRTETSTGLEGSQCTMIRRMAGFWSTTTSTRPLGSLMDRSSLAGTSLTGAVVGPSPHDADADTMCQSEFEKKSSRDKNSDRSHEAKSASLRKAHSRPGN